MTHPFRRAPGGPTWHTDQVSSALVYTAIIVLVVISIVMAATAVWLWRANREDPAPLGPLEMMSHPMWMQAEESDRRVLLDESRPDPFRQVGREAEEAEVPAPRDPSNPIPVIPQFMMPSESEVEDPAT